MLTFTIRRLLLAIPTLLLISLVIFLLLELAPGDPMAQVPLTVPPEVKEKMRQALGLGEPVHIRYLKWIWQFFIIEPMNLIDAMFGTTLAEGQLRVISWQTRSPVMDIVAQQLGVDKGEISRESSFANDLNADSLDTVELVMELEDVFSTSIPDEDAEKIQTVGQAIEFIVSHSKGDG